MKEDQNLWPVVYKKNQRHADLFLPVYANLAKPEYDMWTHAEGLGHWRDAPCALFIKFHDQQRNTEGEEMLQRAASNAYSWWWASHIRTKQSKWMEQNLQDMEEKVTVMLKLIDDDGDSFAKRAEMYYRKRPELIKLVEESFRQYRALAQRYDHISGELQTANTTIATVFPDQVQFGMDDDEDGDSQKMSQPPADLPEIPKPNISEGLKARTEDTEAHLTFPAKKLQPKQDNTSAAAAAVATAADDSLHLSKAEGLEEIDRLQKEILALQTEKEFVKSSYDSRIAKYWEIEEQITEMQETVCSLQDKFNVEAVIEDEEARTLMASAALKSCQEALDQLQEKHEKATKEARVEDEKIKAAVEKYEFLKNEFLQNENQQNAYNTKEVVNGGPISKVLPQVCSLQEQSLESESISEKIRENSNASVTEMAVKIDELVIKVIGLETAVSSQTTLLQRLQSETEELQAHLRSLEDGKGTMMNDLNTFRQKLCELEKELNGIQDLNRNAEHQNNNLETDFSEARFDLEHLSKKLQSVKKSDEETNVTAFEVEEVHANLKGNPFLEFDEPGDLVAPLNNSANAQEELIADALALSFCVNDQDKDLTKSMSRNGLNEIPKETLGLNPWNEFLEQDYFQTNGGVSEAGQQDELTEQDEPNWQQLFLDGLEDREKTLLTEYTSVLRNYKDAKKQLSEIEKKNRDSFFESMVQLRELKISNAMKDDEIRSLRQKLSFLQTSFDENTTMPVFEDSLQEGANLLHSQDVEAATITDIYSKEEQIKMVLVDENKTVSPIEENFRRSIDEVLEENLEFWLKFSTSFQQIQKFQIAVQDLQAEFSRLKATKKQSGSATTTSSDALQIFEHLKEIQTKLIMWLKQNVLLKGELQSRFASLCYIEEEISRVSKASSEAEVVPITSLTAAKFHGEVLDMQQENNKVADELQAGLDHVRALQFEVEETLTKLTSEFHLSGSKKQQPSLRQLMTRPRIPLRSFLFGDKDRRHRRSIFDCMHPALQKQYSDLRSQIP